MLEKNTPYDHRKSASSIGQEGDDDPCGDAAWFRAANQGKGLDAVVRLMIRLEGAARTNLPVAKRISLIRGLQPLVAKVSDRMPKPIETSKQSTTDEAVGQTLQQRLDCLMAKNLKLALSNMGYSDLLASETSIRLRLWLTRELFRFLKRSIDYAVRWDRPYPSGMWNTLHELYFDLVGHQELAAEIVRRLGEFGFDPELEYKRLLLFGLVRQLVPAADRSPRLFVALASLAKESHLEHVESHLGELDLFVVEIAKDEPPHLSNVIDHGFSGWVFKPARRLLDGLERGVFWLS